MALEQEGKISFFGDKEISPMNPDAPQSTGGKKMNPRVADNPKTKQSALAAYTNMSVLKSFSKDTRVALFTFKELVKELMD